MGCGDKERMGCGMRERLVLGEDRREGDREIIGLGCGGIEE